MRLASSLTREGHDLPVDDKNMFVFEVLLRTYVNVQMFEKKLL